MPVWMQEVPFLIEALPFEEPEEQGQDDCAAEAQPWCSKACKPLSIQQWQGEEQGKDQESQCLHQADQKKAEECQGVPAGKQQTERHFFVDRIGLVLEPRHAMQHPGERSHA